MKTVNFRTINLKIKIFKNCKLGPNSGQSARNSDQIGSISQFEIILGDLASPLLIVTWLWIKGEFFKGMVERT